MFFEFGKLFKIQIAIFETRIAVFLQSYMHFLIFKNSYPILIRGN